MLEMNEGRISFADALRPPEGYRLSFAVGTTYSLDLRALLGICIPLGLGFEPEAIDSVNPVSLFAALNRLQGKLVVFCDKGSMRADVAQSSATSGLLMLLEGMVHQVHVNWRRKDALSSFHPKVWVIEYEPDGKGEALYRLLVMSRNLTFDTSWDAVVTLDGHPGEGDACSGHVADFLEFLADGDVLSSTDRDDTRRRGSHTSRIRRLAQTIRGVRFVVDDPSFESADFLPFGPQANDGGQLMDARRSELMTWRWRSMLVVSPFLSDGEGSPLFEFARNRSGESGRFVLLSREDSLNALDERLRDAYECFCPVSSLSDVELDGEGGVDASGYSNLHAKVFFSQDTSGKRRLYIGSLNASRNGTVNNVETLLRLNVRSGRLTFEQMLRPLIGDGKERPPFAPFVPPSQQTTAEEKDEEFRRAFRVASRLIAFRGAKVLVGEDGSSTIQATLEVSSANKVCSSVKITMRPLLGEDTREISIGTRRSIQDVSFFALQPEQVSAFFVLRGTDAEGHWRECVTVCPHDRFDDTDLSLESRSRKLIGSIVTRSDGALAQYIAHAFDLPEAAYAVDDSKEIGTVHTPSGIPTVPPGLYERLLDMADANPAVFERASFLMDLIPDEVHHEELDALRRMVQTFSKAVR